MGSSGDRLFLRRNKTKPIMNAAMSATPPTVAPIAADAAEDRPFWPGEAGDVATEADVESVVGGESVFVGIPVNAVVGLAVADGVCRGNVSMLFAKDRVKVYVRLLRRTYHRQLYQVD